MISATQNCTMRVLPNFKAYLSICSNMARRLKYEQQNLKDGGHTMQKLMKALEDMMVAITFAEAGEYDAAKKISMQDEDAVLPVKTMKTNEA